MNSPNTHHGSHPVHLALSGMVVGVIAFVIGLVVVLLLISAFWWGHRIRARQGPPPLPSEQPRRPEQPTYLEENVDPSDKFPPGGERLMPYELGGHGEEAYQPPEVPEERPGLGSDDTPGGATPGGATPRG